jgi:peroxiredoxin Q/BCP
VAVVGVSKDLPAAQAKFKQKHGLPFPLLSDPDARVMKAYGVWVEKNLYGKKSMGAERSTFVVGRQGKVERVFRKVKVDGHVTGVLEALSGSA